MTKLIGLAKLQRKLDRLPKVAKATIRAAMESAAESVVEMMKRLVPVEDGALRDSIGWTWGKAPKGAGIVSTVKASLGGDMTITIYAGNAEAYYARWVEFGTQKMTAQPFFYVSWRANRKAVRRAIRVATNSAAKQVANG